MKILAVCQYYYPEPMRFPDLCEELAQRGHEVTVLTGVPNYPMGKIYKGYEHGKHKDEYINGVHILRCKTIPRGEGAVKRFLNYYSYAFFASLKAKKLEDDFDVILVNQQSPVMMAWPALAYKKKYSKPIVMYCMDLWPASLAAGDIKGGLVYKWFYHESKKVYSKVDKLLITSKSFADYFEKEFDIKDTVYLPQYAEELFTPKQCRKEPDEYIDLMFAGNVGTAQSVDTIVKAAAKCKDIDNLRWHIVGDGIEIDNLKKLCKDLSAPVIFHGRRPLEEMPHYYAMADAMLVTMQKDDVLSMTLPGKVQTYMAAGKAIIGAIDGEAKHIIEISKCGMCSGAEDSNGLAESVRAFINSDREKLGENSRSYYEEHFAKQIFMDKIELILGQKKLWGYRDEDSRL